MTNNDDDALQTWLAPGQIVAIFDNRTVQIGTVERHTATQVIVKWVPNYLGKPVRRRFKNRGWGWEEIAHVDAWHSQYHLCPLTDERVKDCRRKNAVTKLRHALIKAVEGLGTLDDATLVVATVQDLIAQCMRNIRRIDKGQLLLQEEKDHTDETPRP